MEEEIDVDDSGALLSQDEIDIDRRKRPRTGGRVAVPVGTAAVRLFCWIIIAVADGISGGARAEVASWGDATLDWDGEKGYVCALALGRWSKLGSGFLLSTKEYETSLQYVVS